MPALVAGIHVFLATPPRKDVDGRDERGHDGAKMLRASREARFLLVPGLPTNG